MQTQFQSDVVIDGIIDPLFALKKPFGSLDRHIPKEESNLFQFASRPESITSARSSEIMRSERPKAVVQSGAADD